MKANPYPKEYMQELYASLRKGSEEFIRVKYQRFEEGDIVPIIKQDLRSTSLGLIPLSYAYFVGCDLRDANFSFADVVNVGFKNCDLRGANLLFFSGVIYMKDCDLRGVKWRKGITKLAPADSSFVGSELENVKLDPDFKEYLLRQGIGVQFKLSQDIDKQFDIRKNVSFEE